LSGLAKIMALLGRKDQARENLARSIELLEQIDATDHLKLARDQLAAL
jgi:hypothetical protein